MTKILHIDCETTGLNPQKHDILELGLMIEIDGKIKEKHDIFMQPFNYKNIEEEALKVNNLTIEKIRKFAHPRTVYPVLNKMFSKYINKYDKNDKFAVSGYNVFFDLNFLSEFWIKNNDKYFGSFVDWRQRLDPLPLLSMIQFKGFHKFENLKLETICKYFNIPLDNAHNALADIIATRELLNVVLGYVNKPN
jgi:DNA polymerase-3 subunit epsilon